MIRRCLPSTQASIGVSNFAVDHLERITGDTGVVPAVNQIELLHAFSSGHCGRHTSGIASSPRPGAHSARQVPRGSDAQGDRAASRAHACAGRAALAHRKRLRGDPEIGDACSHGREHRRVRLRVDQGGSRSDRGPRQCGRTYRSRSGNLWPNASPAAPFSPIVVTMAQRGHLI